MNTLIYLFWTLVAVALLMALNQRTDLKVVAMRRPLTREV